MKKTMSKILILTIICGLFISSVSIISANAEDKTAISATSAATQDVITVTGTVSAVNIKTNETKPVKPGRWEKPIFPSVFENTISITKADGTAVDVEIGRFNKDITVKVGDKVSVTGFYDNKNSKTLKAISFTGTDGKLVEFKMNGKELPGDVEHGIGTDKGGNPNATIVSITGTVSSVTIQPKPTTQTKPEIPPVSKTAKKPEISERKDRVEDSIVITKNDGTTITVIFCNAKDISVKVGDSVTITGFENTKGAGTIIAKTFIGADGKTITLDNGMHIGFNKGIGKGPKTPNKP